MGNREDEPGDAPSATGETLPAPSATGETVPSPPSATGETVLAPSPPSTRSARSTSAPAAPAPAPAASSSSRLGRYELLEQLGAGGMGVVHRGRDPALGRDLAIKLVRPRREGADARSRMVREAQAMARLHHPGVLPIFDVGSDGDRVFLVMPYMPGGTLGGWLRAAPRAVDAVVARFVAAGRGLAAAHALGMIHRDFKPDNVLLGAHGEVQVADFGLARLGEDDVAVARTATPDLASELTRTGDVMGTPAYMAPEQLAGEPVDARADQFSFCVALWEALCGRRPFDSGAAAGADALASLLAEILAGRIQPPPPERAVPASLLATLRRGLAADPAARWPSMDALLAALAPYAPSTTTTAGPAAPSPWPRRRRWLAVAAVPIARAAAAARWLRGRGEPGAPPPPIATATDAELAARCDRTGRPDGAACAALADRELRHLDGPPDFARAHGLALRACDAGIADGCAQVAELATWGNGVAVDRTRALALARRACDGGSGRGCGALGELVEARGEPGDAAAAVAGVAAGLRPRLGRCLPRPGQPAPLRPRRAGRRHRRRRRRRPRGRPRRRLRRRRSGGLPHPRHDGARGPRRRRRSGPRRRRPATRLRPRLRRRLRRHRPAVHDRPRRPDRRPARAALPATRL
ncbi:MAG: protein kinase [Kofleriaceae bacterium]|nr:protein kinase [Kofleriaceae bacterium]